MNALKILLAGAALAVSAAGANAAVFYADKVISKTPGTCTPSCSGVRQNANNALGAADGSFYSLGFGGELVVGFNQAVFEPAQNVSVYEVTWDRVHGHNEAVDVYSVLGGVSTYLGRILNTVADSKVLANTAFEYIRLVDATLDEFGAGGTSSNDGFDVDSVAIAAVPLPAAGMLLLGGLGGLAALRRRKKAA